MTSSDWTAGSVPGGIVSLSGPCSMLARSVRQTYRRSSGPEVWGRVSGAFVMPLNTRPPGLAWPVRSIG